MEATFNDEPDCPTGSRPAKTSGEFYYVQPLFIRAEDTVFCVNRKLFVDDSEFFRELFALPPEPGKPVEGTTSDHPLVLQRVNKSDMILLLRALYPSHICDADEMTCEEWVRLLQLLSKWRFAQCRQAVLKKLETIADPVSKILIWEEYGLDEDSWLVPAVDALASRHEPLTIDEGRRLGMEHVIKIASIRERDGRCDCDDCRQSKRSCPPRQCPNRPNRSFARNVKEVYMLQ